MQMLLVIILVFTLCWSPRFNLIYILKVMTDDSGSDDDAHDGDAGGGDDDAW